jgi:hypothetical protein
VTSAPEHFDGPGRLRDQFVILLAESARPRLGTRALTEALLQQSFVLLPRRKVEKKELPIQWMATLADHGLARALRALFEYTSEKFTVQRLATIAGSGRSPFSHSWSSKKRRAAQCTTWCEVDYTI